MTEWKMCQCLKPLICVALTTLLSTHTVAVGNSSNTGDRPKIGLALSGGGARGAAHIGVLKVLEAHRIPVDYIAGTSMGALVGGLYASGMSPEELEKAISEMDLSDAFIDRIPREDRSFHRKRDDDLYLVKNKPGLSGTKLKFPTGILDGQKVDLLLKRYTLPVVKVRDFDDLSIPYRAIAADIVTGDTVVIGHGDLALAIRSSMSIPALFSPREIDGRLLVDGGITCNLPVDVVRQMGADIIIAVDISTPLQERKHLKSVLAITNQLTGILTVRNTHVQINSLTENDIFIKPDLGDITTASFDRAAEAIPVGVTATEAVLDELMRLSVSEQVYDEYLGEREWRAERPVIDEIRIVNESRLSDGIIAERLNVKTGRPLDIEQLEKNLDQIYGLELFESVYYDITSESDHNVLTVTVREASWGPNYLQFGGAVFEDFEGPNFNLAVAYLRTTMNRLNGEWRTGLQIGQEPGLFTEFYQPLDRRLRNFIQLKMSLCEYAENVFDLDGNKLSESGIMRYGIELAGGRELGTWGEIRAGVIREAGKIKIQVGNPDVPDRNFNTGEAYLQFFVDELDNVKFPHSGGSLRIRLSAGLKELDSDNEYEQGTIEGFYARSFGRYTGLLSGYFATTRAGNAPIQRLFSLGGLTQLSGIEQNELKGQHAAVLSATFYRRIWNFNLVPLYAGLSLEYGNVFQEKGDIAFKNGIAACSVFLGLDTIIGPIHIAYGRTESGRDNFYLSLGQSLTRRFAGFRNYR